jgi:hypothetical protein
MAHSHLHLTDRQIGSMPVAAVSCKAPDNRIPMPHYDAALSLRDARGVYFAANNLGEGGYQDKWVKLALGPVRFAFPNTAGRVRAVRYHDLHHVVTGYATDWTGEAEIGAWEIASGCRDMIAAWVLNLYAMWIGLWVAPRAVWRAFARGRHTRNLYAEPWSEALLEESVGSMRRRLALESEMPRTSLSDRIRFAGWSTAAVALATASGAPLWLLAWAIGAHFW